MHEENRHAEEHHYEGHHYPAARTFAEAGEDSRGHLGYHPTGPGRRGPDALLAEPKGPGGPLMSRGDGRIFKVKGSNKFHCAVCVDGVEVRWSSGSESEDKARKQLKKATAQIECGVFIGPSEQRLKFEDLVTGL